MIQMGITKRNWANPILGESPYHKYTKSIQPTSKWIGEHMTYNSYLNSHIRQNKRTKSITSIIDLSTVSLLSVNVPVLSLHSTSIPAISSIAVILFVMAPCKWDLDARYPDILTWMHIFKGYYHVNSILVWSFLFFFFFLTNHIKPWWRYSSI